MTEWNEVTLREVCKDISYGYTASATDIPTGIKFLRITDIVKDRINWASVPYCQINDADIKKYKLSVGDIVIARTGATTGYNAIIKDEVDAVFASYLIRYKVNNASANPFFVGYVLQSNKFQDYVDAIAGGSAQPGANAQQLADFEFTLPPLPEQQVVAEVLSSLDDKIDLLHRQNKTLEALAETLFRQWFVEEAEESWGNGFVTDLVDLNPKRSLSKATVAPYLEMSNLSSELYHPHDWYDRIFTSGTKFINGDTLLARITPCLENGKTAYVDFLKDDEVGWGSTEFIVMRPKAPLHPFFSYILARHNDFRNFAIGCIVGSSGRQRADVDNLAT